MLLEVFKLQKRERDLIHELDQWENQETLKELKKVQEQIDLLLSAMEDSHGT